MRATTPSDLAALRFVATGAVLTALLAGCSAAQTSAAPRPLRVRIASAHTAHPLRRLKSASSTTGGAILDHALPPRPGTYRYRWTSDGVTSAFDLTFKTAFATPTFTMQERVFSYKGATSEEEIAWRPAGVFTSGLTIKENGCTYDYNWRPQLTNLIFPLRVGSSWSGESSLTIQGSNYSVDHLSYTERVIRQDRRTINGRTIPVWVIAGSNHRTAFWPSMQSSETVINYFAPAYGLSVYRQYFWHKPDGSTAVSDEVLLDLKPEPAPDTITRPRTSAVANA